MSHGAQTLRIKHTRRLQHVLGSTFAPQPQACGVASNALVDRPGLGINQQFLRPSRRPDRHPTSLLESVLTLGGSCTRHDVSAASTKQASLQSRWVLAGPRGSFSRRFETGEPPVSKPHGAPKPSSCPHAKGSSTEVDIPWPILLSALVPRQGISRAQTRTREQICKGDFRESAIHGDREGADGCGSMSERRRRKEKETPAVERAVNHSDTDSDSVDSESDHEGRCRSFCASTPCQYSVLYALCSAVAAGHTCHMSATARCVLRTKPGAVIFVISTPYGVLNQPPAGSATNGGQRRRGIGKTMDGFSLDFKYQSLAPVLMIAGLGCMVVAHIFSSLLASLLA